MPSDVRHRSILTSDRHPTLVPSCTRANVLAAAVIVDRQLTCPKHLICRPANGCHGDPVSQNRLGRVPIVSRWRVLNSDCSPPEVDYSANAVTCSGVDSISSRSPCILLASAHADSVGEKSRSIADAQIDRLRIARESTTFAVVPPKRAWLVDCVSVESTEEIVSRCRRCPGCSPKSNRSEVMLSASTSSQV